MFRITPWCPILPRFMVQTVYKQYTSMLQEKQGSQLRQLDRNHEPLRVSHHIGKVYYYMYHIINISQQVPTGVLHEASVCQLPYNLELYNFI